MLVCRSRSTNEFREKVCSRADVSQSRRNDLIGAENAIARGGSL